MFPTTTSPIFVLADFNPRSGRALKCATTLFIIVTTSPIFVLADFIPRSFWRRLKSATTCFLLLITHLRFSGIYSALWAQTEVCYYVFPTTTTSPIFVLADFNPRYLSQTEVCYYVFSTATTLPTIVLAEFIPRSG